MTARQLINEITDLGTWIELPTLSPRHVDPDYGAQLKRAAIRAGESESVVTGTGSVDGEPFVLVVSEFGFLGGSVGQAAVDLVLRAIETALERHLPLLMAPCSGGTRMQEGAAAFARMIEIAGALDRHREAGLLSVSYLRHPTTGGVLATWGSLSSITFAEPDALLGFLGPKVFAELRGAPFPGGIQHSSHLAAHGLVDAIVTVDQLRSSCGALSRSLRLARGEDVASRPPTFADDSEGHRALAPDVSQDGLRPAGAILDAFDERVFLSGDESGSLNTGAQLVLARWNDLAVVCFALGTSLDDPDTSVGDLRVARRGMRLAKELRLPYLALVDTPGAELSVHAETSGMAREIARCLREMAALPVPTISVLLDRGCGGAALALLGGRMRIAMHGSWLSPLPLEGASVLLFGTPNRATEAGRRQRVHAPELLEDGVVDVVLECSPFEDLSTPVLDAVRRTVRRSPSSDPSSAA
ncbi:MAG: carboxyl transferase [Marmoricola sp.]|nr:carboxyl transferase [Marmoricola sp.]